MRLKFFAGYTEQDRALSDGRIGPEVVKIDTNGRCGNMDISENLEVKLGCPKPSPCLESSPYSHLP